MWIIFSYFFAIAGPIFMLFGIGILYSKLLKKMTENPNETPASFSRKTS